MNRLKGDANSVPQDTSRGSSDRSQPQSASGGNAARLTIYEQRLLCGFLDFHLANSEAALKKALALFKGSPKNIRQQFAGQIAYWRNFTSALRYLRSNVHLRQRWLEDDSPTER
jgi:hypothetical protein